MIMYIFSEIKYHSNGPQVVAKIKKYAILLSERTWLFLIKKRDTFDLGSQVLLSPFWKCWKAPSRRVGAFLLPLFRNNKLIPVIGIYYSVY